MKCINSTHQGVSLTIEFDKYVYQPGPLTSMLSDIMDVIPGDRVIDVGCGTGYLGILASMLGASEVIAIDPISEALKWTRHNIRLNGVHNITVIQGEALDPVGHEQADLILTLPPQMPYPTNFNPGRYGGPDGTEVIIKIIRQAQFILKKKGSRLFLVHTALAYPAKIREIISASQFQWKVVKKVKKKLDFDDLNTLAPQLSDYLLNLARRGIAEIDEREGLYFYPVWFYRAIL